MSRRFDAELVRSVARFVAGAPSRHRRLAAASFAWVLALSLLAAAALPRTFRIETELSIRPVPAALAAQLPRPGRGEERDRTRGALERALGAASMDQLVASTNLLEAWEASRPLPMRLKDAVMARLRRPPTREEKLDALVDVVETKLEAGFDGSSVRIEFEWPEPRSGVRFVQAFSDRFLSLRHEAEMEAISEATGILERRKQELIEPLAAARAKATKLDAQAAEQSVREEAWRAVSDLRNRLAQMDNRLLEAGLAADATRRAVASTEVVLRPPELPQGPVKPNLTGMIFGGILGGLAVALAAAVMADLASRRIVDRGQVTGALGLDVLGEVAR